jgi:hypothetical protein
MARVAIIGSNGLVDVDLRAYSDKRAVELTSFSRETPFFFKETKQNLRQSFDQSQYPI